jgi:hypothetical protein
MIGAGYKKLPCQEGSFQLVKWLGGFWLYKWGRTLRASRPVYIIYHPLGREAPGNERRGYACAGVRACANEIQVVIAGMFIARAEVGQLGQIVTQPVRGTFHQVIALAPGERGVIHLEFDVLFQIDDANRL